MALLPFMEGGEAGATPKPPRRPTKKKYVYPKAGDRIERLLVIRIGYTIDCRGRRRKSFWVRCDCGVEKYVAGNNLAKGVVRSCGCLHKDIMKERVGIIVSDKNGARQFPIGHRFGMMEIVGPCEPKVIANKRGLRTLWCYPVRCDCGTEKLIDCRRLLNGREVSCGCYAREATSKRQKTHGGSDTRLYKTWRGMRDRCQNPRCYAYLTYGARGIGVCPEWEDFAVFRDWALASGYRDDLTIERKDPEKDYDPGNCTWATTREQNENRRSTIRVTAFGETKSVTAWTRDPRCAVGSSAIKQRLYWGWASQEAISTPPLKPGTRRIGPPAEDPR